MTPFSLENRKKRLKLSLLSPGVALRIKTFGSATLEQKPAHGFASSSPPSATVHSCRRSGSSSPKRTPFAWSSSCLFLLSTTHVHNNFQIGMREHVMIKALSQMSRARKAHPRKAQKLHRPRSHGMTHSTVEQGREHQCDNDVEHKAHAAADILLKKWLYSVMNTNAAAAQPAVAT